MRHVLAATALLLFTAVSAQAEDPFAACDPPESGWNDCGCLYNVGLRHGLHDEAARRLEALAEEDPEAPCPLFQLGRLRLLAGGDDALELLLASADGFARRGEVEGEVYARLNAARLDGRADDQLEQARAVAESAGRDDLLAQVLLQVARRALARGDDLLRVERDLVEAAERMGDGESPSFWREYLQARGNARYLLGRFDEAEGFYERMAEVCRASGDLYGEATARLNRVIARTAPGLGPSDRETVRGLLAEALEVAVSAGQRHAEAEARLRLGRLPGEDGRLDRGELEQALVAARELGERSLAARVLSALAVAELDRDPDRARELARESARESSASPHYGSSDYGWAGRMEVAWRTSGPAEATAAGLEALDRVEELRLRRREAGERAEVFAVWTEIYYALAGRLLEAAEAADSGQDRARFLDAAFGVMERMRARVLWESLAASGDGPAPGEPTDFDAVRASLGPQEALLSFQSAPWETVYGTRAGGSWLTVVTADDARAYRLPGRDRLESALSIFLPLVARRDGSEEPGARRLHDLLLGPALADLPPAVDRLVLVADGVLHRLPFALLRDAAGRPLVERFRLSSVPSAGLWARGRSAPPAERPSRVLALGDPEPTADELPPLPAARREARAAVRRIGGRALLGKEATEERVRGASGGPFGVLHFAAHAVVDPLYPDRSSVRLAADRLTAAEIRELRLPGRLVVLSTCRGADGRLLAGEGPMSLARAFFEAGAATVVAGLWPLRDDETAVFFDDFYGRLGTGDSVGEAVAAAQRTARERGDPTAAWAGIVVYGSAELEVEARPTAWGSRSAWIASGVLLASMVLLASVVLLRLVPGIRRRNGVRRLP